MQPLAQYLGGAPATIPEPGLFKPPTTDVLGGFGALGRTLSGLGRRQRLVLEEPADEDRGHLARRAAIRAALAGRTVLLHTPHAGPEAVAQSLVTLLCGVADPANAHHPLSVRRAVVRAEVILGASPLYISDDPAVPIAHAAGIAREVQRRYGRSVDLVVTERPFLRYVGAPAEVRAYDGKEFGNRYDALVDPVSGTITLIFRVKFQPAESAQFGGVPPGVKGWEESNQRALAEFKVKFKGAVEAAWSGKGSVKPVCPGARVPSFATRVNVQVVDSGQHVTFEVFGISAGLQSHMEVGAPRGKLRIGDVDKSPTSQQLRGQAPMSSEQVTAAHEFGHAIGLHHVACDGNALVCYGVNPKEHGDVMGGGMAVQSLNTTSVRRTGHDDFEPFYRIGERWGRDVFPAALAKKCNTWTSEQ